MAKPIKYLDLEGLKALYGVVDGKITVEKNRAEAAEKVLSDKIDAMNLTDSAVDGEFITTVSQLDGKVTIARGKVASDKVTAVPVSGGTGTVAIEGTTVDAQIKSLGQTLKTVEGNAAKYRVVTLTADEIAGLSGVVTANVDRAYKVVSYTGEWDTATNKSQVGEAIIIYKDSALESVTASGDENTVITFKYKLADGTPKTVSVDLSKAIFESEMGNGMQVVDSKIAIKLDTANEGKFLTVGADGLKLSGVQKAIDTAVANKNVSAVGDEYIAANAANNKVTVSADVQPLTVATTPGKDSTISGVEKSLVDGKEVANKVASFTNARIREEIAKLDATVGEDAVAADKHVAVQVVETDGQITAVNVNEKDIASKTALDGEIDRATKAEAKALADAKAYTDGQFTGRTTIAQYGILDAKIVGQTITLGNETLTFTAWTPKEIQDAAKQSA